MNTTPARNLITLPRAMLLGILFLAPLASPAAAQTTPSATASPATTTETIRSRGFAKYSKDSAFRPYEFDRHAVGEHDILIEILYAGICHSDIHHALEDWRKEEYPMVPGHEIVGRVAQVGTKVTKFKVGDHAGVGCMVNSCRSCENCGNHEEQYCDRRVMTYASKDHYHGGLMTQGGYSDRIVLSQDFAIKVPEGAELDKVAPLLCAGITTYSPIKHTKIGKGDKVAVAGFGGLGHMAVQYAVKLGAEVTVFDITDDKRQDALSMGAVKYVNVNTPDELKGLDNTFRVLISTIPAKYDLAMYVKMLRLDGDLVVLGLPAMRDQPSVNAATLLSQSRRRVWGSQIGGIKETQEMLDYSVANRIYPRVEIIPFSKLDEAYQRVLKGEVKFRYVIDTGTLDASWRAAGAAPAQPGQPK